LAETHGQTAYVNYSNDVIKGAAPLTPLDPAAPAADFEKRFPFEKPEFSEEDASAPSPNLSILTEGGTNYGPDELFNLVVWERVGDGIKALPVAQQELILKPMMELHEQFPFRVQHIDVHPGFHTGVDEGGLGLERGVNGVTYGADDGEAVIMLTPDAYGPDFEDWLQNAEMKSDWSKTTGLFGKGPRQTPIGTPFNAGFDHTHVIYHEYGHAADLEMRPRLAGQKFAKPEYQAYDDLMREFHFSDASNHLSEYGKMNEEEQAAELFAVTFNPAVDRAALHPDVAAYADRLEKTLTDMGIYKPLGKSNPLAGKTVREANAAKRGSVYADQKAALLPKSITEDFANRYRGVGKHMDPDPDVARAAQMFGKWSGRVVENGLLKGNNAVHAGILHDAAGIPTHSAVPYNLTEALAHQVATQAMSNKWQDAFRLQYFAQERSMLERSINHPMFGLYPASYMWGKLAPEVIQFIAQRPFGIRTGGAAYSLMDAQKAIAVQREFDPGFQKKIDDLGTSQAMSFGGYLLPTLPWDITASAPIWMKDIAQQGLDNEQAADNGGQVSGFNALKPATDTIKKLNPLETTLPWAARAVGELQGSDKQDTTAVPTSYGTADATTGADLGTPLGRVMQELQEALAR
jgi:hypothetical protein